MSLMEPTADEAEEAYRLYEELRCLRAEVTSLFLRIGRILMEIGERCFYRHLGHDSFDEFLGDPELDFGVGRRQLYRYMSAARLADRVYGLDAGTPEVERRLQAIGARKIGAIAAVVDADPEHAEEWLNKAEALSVSALQDEVDEALGLRRSVSEWIQRRCRRIQNLAQMVIDGSIDTGKAMDSICSEAMHVRESLVHGESPDMLVR